ncbi:MAG TPA: glycerol kinase GlpK [Gordonia sp. (in: high G+C Gram-positive bacteria)]|uniref:glycerol kinase GlpK n=1 Tax=unclassified Gordonia (in: high G+C Gram-positive bacteria) TaxID=2657482 RepID=UPI000F9FF5AF|nr:MULTISPECIES: glycerol kinase GlpK [unclassified Gordonia (in: high G+C Gram-positive bacteria)]RUP37088.1 MAG: glycerol kinase [Gordonia sp. (in: high G+C Gram-positive bacteria)]HRC50131.1 glycerol kinase GlpK [Gordonia sp. (in: high G+C Gram-positive bacteria)]
MAGVARSSGYVLSIDQGTTSSRAILFDHRGRPVGSEQIEHAQIFPKPGWVEHDAEEIWRNVRRVTAAAMASAEVKPDDVMACGITNQRETTVVWDRRTGVPVYNAIVWQDTRTAALCERLAGDDGPDRYRARTGLPLSTYFAGPKLVWLLENVDGVRERAEAGDLCFGTIDSWLAWNMTGGVNGGLHITDVTNASRTMLMDLRTLQWDEQICSDFGIPRSMLPQIRSSSEVYGELRSPGAPEGVPLAGILGDQQAATFGQACLAPGQAKNTYGTGNFLLLNTGTEPVFSEHGLLTTVCYQIGGAPACYALEGSIAVTGSLIQWLRDNLGMISSAAEVEELAKSVDDNGGAYIVPAFSGLFAPRWRPDARGVIVGLTRFINRGHLARAALEASAYQTREVIEAMEADSGVRLTTLKVDGGMVVNDLLMQFQADVLGVPVIRPVVNETTALGAAYAAGLAVGYWRSADDIHANWAQDKQWDPGMPDDERARLYAEWNRAVEHSLDLA